MDYSIQYRSDDKYVTADCLKFFFIRIQKLVAYVFTVSKFKGDLELMS